MPHTDQNYNSKDDFEILATAVRSLEEIGSEFNHCKDCDFPDERVIAALKLAGYKRDYFSMDYFLNVLTKYRTHFGDDRFFYGAAKLAYSYSDGEYAGWFEKQFPEMVRHFQNQMTDDQ